MKKLLLFILLSTALLGSIGFAQGEECVGGFYAGTNVPCVPEGVCVYRVNDRPCNEASEYCKPGCPDRLNNNNNGIPNIDLALIGFGVAVLVVFIAIAMGGGGEAVAVAKQFLNPVELPPPEPPIMNNQPVPPPPTPPPTPSPLPPTPTPPQPSPQKPNKERVWRTIEGFRKFKK
jgi:hypothetical protein